MNKRGTSPHATRPPRRHRPWGPGVSSDEACSVWRAVTGVSAVRTATWLQVVLVLAVAVAGIVGAAGGPATAAPAAQDVTIQASLPPLPTGWPTTLQLGRGDAPG